MELKGVWFHPNNKSITPYINWTPNSLKENCPFSCRTSYMLLMWKWNKNWNKNKKKWNARTKWHSPGNNKCIISNLCFMASASTCFTWTLLCFILVWLLLKKFFTTFWFEKMKEAWNMCRCIQFLGWWKQVHRINFIVFRRIFITFWVSLVRCIVNIGIIQRAVFGGWW